jgi:hypothetical protein
MFLHIMVGQNSKKSNATEVTFLNFIWCGVRIYLCKKYICHDILKTKNKNSKYDGNDF